MQGLRSCSFYGAASFDFSEIKALQTSEEGRIRRKTKTKERIKSDSTEREQESQADIK